MTDKEKVTFRWIAGVLMLIVMAMATAWASRMESKTEEVTSLREDVISIKKDVAWQRRDIEEIKQLIREAMGK